MGRTIDAPTDVQTRVVFIDPRIDLARSGDADAFEALLRPRLDGLFRTACAILGNDADGWDATQDACVSAWRDLPRLREPERFDAWLSKILVNACRGRLRRPHRIRELPMGDSFDRAGPDRDDPAIRLEAAAISRAFDRLGADERAILVLHYLRHERVASIAQALGVAEGTVKSRLYAARRSLQRALEREG